MLPQTDSCCIRQIVVPLDVCECTDQTQYRPLWKNDRWCFWNFDSCQFLAHSHSKKHHKVQIKKTASILCVYCFGCIELFVNYFSNAYCARQGIARYCRMMSFPSHQFFFLLYVSLFIFTTLSFFLFLFNIQLFLSNRWATFQMETRKTNDGKQFHPSLVHVLSFVDIDRI